MQTTMASKFEQSLNRLIDLAKDDYYNPYEEFKWPEQLPTDMPWMSYDLMSIHDTELAKRLTPAEQLNLSRFESINFYGLNVHGIRELIIEVVARIHTPGFELPSEFFHLFVGEENEHMWFFAQFCLKYGGKLYPDKKIKLDGFTEPDIQSFLVFARILMFEEIVDYFNARMAKDNDLPPIVQQINRIHHQDESRHIAFGREIVKQLYNEMCKNHNTETVDRVGEYVERFLITMVRDLYNPAIYRDAGFENPYDIRTALLTDPGRQPHHDRFLKRTVKFFNKEGIIKNDRLNVAV